MRNEAAAFDIGDPAQKENIILKIQDHFYSNINFEKFLTRMTGEDYKDYSAETLSRLFDNFVEEKILLAAARNQGISLTGEEKETYIAQVTSQWQPDEEEESFNEIDTDPFFNRLLIDKYTNMLIQDLGVVEEEIEAYYESHQKDFLRPETVKVSQILVSREDLAVEILKEVQDGTVEDFRRIAVERSIGMEASKGGEMGVFEFGELPFELEREIFKLKEGEISRVVESRYGFHIFRLDKRFEAEHITLEDASPEIQTEIRMKVLEQKISEALAQHIEELKSQLVWTIYPENLSFPYQRKIDE